jgi:hypothetical protein
MKMRLARIAFTITALAGLALTADPETGSVCVAQVPAKPDPRSASGLFCSSEKLSLKIDATTIDWPIKESVRIDALNTSVKHRVAVLCDHKPQQSFGFRFSDFKTTELCLFLNDLYKTVQLQEIKQCPWCKCK